MIGKGQILLDGRLDELKHRFSDVKTLEADYQGNEPHLPENVQLLQKDVGRLVLKLDPKGVSVAQLLSLLSKLFVDKDKPLSRQQMRANAFGSSCCLRCLLEWH